MFRAKNSKSIISRSCLRIEPLESRRLLAAIHMTDQEQLLLELVNRARANPEAEAARFGLDLNDGIEEGKEIDPSPKQPLAPNPQLIEAARGHSQAMLDYDFFAHENPRTKKGPADRARDAGYGAGAGENIAWAGDGRGINRDGEVYDRHQALFESPGHRINMYRGFWRELGNGIKYGFYTETGQRPIESIMVTENFGQKPGERFITGVAYTDARVPDYFYTIGEGIEGMTVEAVDQKTGTKYSTVTGSSGGYSLKVPDGIYVVTGRKAGLQTIVVNNVSIVDDRRSNQKVDFNTRDSGLGSISGQVFLDEDEDGRLDAGEEAVADQTIYVDQIPDDRMSTHEFQIQTDQQGNYRMTGLRPGDYRIRIDNPDSQSVTFPSNEIYEFSLGRVRNVTHVSFGIANFNSAPVVVADEGRTVEGNSVVIDVLANDSDPEGNIDKSSVSIFQDPLHGQVRVDDFTGEVVYIPEDGFVGADVFGYTVKDEKGLESEPVRVDILVSQGVGKFWQNPSDPMDVNADGFMAPNDVLSIINEINRNGARAFARSDSLPPPFYDVNGDGLINPTDALIVTNEINRQTGLNAFADFSNVESADVAFAIAELENDTRFHKMESSSRDRTYNESSIPERQKVDLIFQASEIESIF